MNALAGVRKKLRQALGPGVSVDFFAAVSEDEYISSLAREWLDAESEAERKDAWGPLEDGVRRALRFWNRSRETAHKNVQGAPRGRSQEMRQAEKRDTEERGQNLDVHELFGERTWAMTEAMSTLFAVIGNQIPEVMAFRERVLSGRVLTADEAHALIASCAARALCPNQFEEWGIPFVGHHAEVLDMGPRGPGFSPVDHWMTMWIDPPGITKTVRYAYLREGDSDTRCTLRSGAIIPIHTYFPVESHGAHVYPSWLWPGSVVDELYELSVELADTFDWPRGSSGNLTGTRPRSASATWFILTGEAPRVHPIDARWEHKHGSTHLSPQWRIQLTIPPWLSEEEVVRVLRTLKRQGPKGHQMPKTVKPLEVARFVWERERLDGYREPAPWTAWLKQWNDEHPGHRIKTASNFRTYFLRGSAAVTHLNLDWPDFEVQPREGSGST